ncbi:MAG: tetratricopeptide repeat protein, partial [Cytophagales bacterium]|nr:tetratricopeptide repeat protein [Cytophagales bacterium]
LELLDKVANLQPYDSEVPYMRANVWTLQGNYEEAIEEYKSILTSIDERDQVYHQIAFAYQGMERYDMAIDYYKRP